MADQKEPLVALKYIHPADLEYFLSEHAAEGWELQPLNDTTSLFYYVFREEKVRKCRYVVDATSLPKNMYMDKLIGDGWEYLGTSMNCYIWRKYYDDGQAPKNFSDKACLKKHCTNLGIVLALALLLLIATMIAFIWGATNSYRMGDEAHVVPYIVEAVIQVPFILYLVYAVKKLLLR